MKIQCLTIAALACIVGSASLLDSRAEAHGKNSKVGGAEMFGSKDIIDNASASPIHKTLVAAVKAAGLVDTLKGAGPFTVFAPTDDAFKKLPAGTVENLLKPENKEKLASILTYHVVSGKTEAGALIKAIKSGGGKAELKTVNGKTLTATLSGDKVVLKDNQGGEATVTQTDVEQKNGVIHVIDTVLMP